jgi:hypothetical protein
MKTESLQRSGTRTCSEQPELKLRNASSAHSAKFFTPDFLPTQHHPANGVWQRRVTAPHFSTVAGWHGPVWIFFAAGVF